jgi:hypothetical protein
MTLYSVRTAYSWQQCYEVPNEMTIVPGYWICSVAESTEGQNEGDTVQSKLWGEVLEQRERWCTKPVTVVQRPWLCSVSGRLSGTGTSYVQSMSWGSSVTIVSDYRLEDRGSSPGRGKGFFSLAPVSRPVMRPTQPPIQCVPESFPEGKARDANHSPPSTADLKNE